MPNLSVVIPDSLASILNNAVARRATSPDSVVTAALSEYFQSGRHRAYQISTSAALVQGVSAGAVSSRRLLANGDFGLGTFEHLDGEMVVLDGIIYQVRGGGTIFRFRLRLSADFSPMRTLKSRIPAVSMTYSEPAIFTANPKICSTPCVWTAFLSACIHAQ